MTSKAKFISALFALSSFSGTCALASSINIYSTGVSVTNGVDNHYDITAGPTSHAVVSGTGSAAAYLTTDFGGGWVADSATSKWISPAADANQNFRDYFYTYETTFTLAGLNPNTAELTGKLAADDDVTVYLNGEKVLKSFGTWTSFATFSIDDNFVAGVNTLDFVVDNDGSGPTGLDVAISGTAKSAAPEPATCSLLAGAGLVGLAGLLRRRTKKQANR
jgi:hypothetical protein